MLLAIDVGNSNVALGLFRGEDLAAHWRLSTRLDKTADEAGIELVGLFRLGGFDTAELEAAIIASVVPSLNPALTQAISTYLGVAAHVVGPGTRTGVRIRYDNPRDVGSDRIANALAAQRRHGAPAIVIDFGTAVTYDVIDGEGIYLGGAIAAGLGIALDALIAHTARLPRVEPVAPPSVIGRSTVAAIQSGAIHGLAAQVEGMVSRIREELGAPARVVATGGHAEVVASVTGVIDVVDPVLTLEGLRLIHLQNADAH